MTINKGLGKGLAALFSEIENQSITSYDKDGKLNKGVQEIEIDLIEQNPNQPRKTFDEESLNELAQSIKTMGVIQPIIVIEKNGKYVIIAGERRFRASKIAKLNKIPAIVRDYTERECKEVALIENIQRENLNPIEEAVAYKTLIEEYGITQEALATTLGKSRPVITNSMRLLQLCDSVKQLVLDNKLSSGHARSLVSVKNSEMQTKLANDAIKKNISVSDLQKVINKLSEAEDMEIEEDAIINAEKREKMLASELRLLNEEMQRLFATKVKITGTKKKGKITIDYFSKEDLLRIIHFIEVLKNKRN